MSTKFPEPKNSKFQNVDGWVLPDYSDKKFQRDDYAVLRADREIWDPVNSFENQQGIFGQYSHFYSLKWRNNYVRSCYKLCIRADTLATSNISQDDKLCARECIISAEKFNTATKVFVEKKVLEEVKMAVPL